MDDNTSDILVDVTANLTNIWVRLDDLARHERINKDQALVIADLATNLSKENRRITKLTGWNGRDFSGNGDRVSASYDVPGLHEVSKRIIEKVAGAPVTDIAHLIPQILEIVFPQLAPKIDTEEDEG
ncbi:hypothetical protein O9X98_07260 [Agrobacterium salinitolerans]|nr:hypothetical protein [Agrobacterium salinitolerans]